MSICGGIGRRARLKIWCPQGLKGSSPFRCTKDNQKIFGCLFFTFTSLVKDYKLYSYNHRLRLFYVDKKTPASVLQVLSVPTGCFIMTKLFYHVL